MGLFQSKPLAHSQSIQTQTDEKADTESQLKNMADAVDIIISSEESKIEEIKEPTYTEKFEYVEEITPRPPSPITTPTVPSTCTYTDTEEFKSSEGSANDEGIPKTNEMRNTEETVDTQGTRDTEGSIDTDDVLPNEENEKDKKKKKRSKRNRAK